MIKIQEVFVFGQVITAVIDVLPDKDLQRTNKILDLRKGEVSEHAKKCARYHAKKQKQGIVKIDRVDSFDSFLPVEEKEHE